MLTQQVMVCVCVCVWLITESPVWVHRRRWRDIVRKVLKDKRMCGMRKLTNQDTGWKALCRREWSEL